MECKNWNFSLEDQRGLALKIRKIHQEGVISSIELEAIRERVLNKIPDAILGYSSLLELIKNQVFIILSRRVTDDRIQEILDHATYQ